MNRFSDGFVHIFNSDGLLDLLRRTGFDRNPPDLDVEDETESAEENHQRVTDLENLLPLIEGWLGARGATFLQPIRSSTGQLVCYDPPTVGEQVERAKLPAAESRWLFICEDVNFPFRGFGYTWVAIPDCWEEALSHITRNVTRVLVRSLRCIPAQADFDTEGLVEIPEHIRIRLTVIPESEAKP